MIYGERIRLRGVEKGDLQKFFEWVNDPDVKDGITLVYPMSMQDEETWFDKTHSREQAEKPLAIESQQDGVWQLIGSCAFFNLDWRERSSEFGIMIGDKSVWDKGYGTEAVRLLLKQGFEIMNLNRVYLQVHADNPRAIRAYEKCGFVHEGTLREAVYKKGKYFDMHIMSVLRAEWNAPK